LKALLFTVDYPPNKGGVSRYYEGLVEVSGARIGVAGIDLGEKPPNANTLKTRIAQIFWTKKVLKQTSKDLSILMGQPHLGLGSMLARRKFGLFIHGGEWGNYPFGTKLVRFVMGKARILIVNSEATANKYVPKYLRNRLIVLKPGLSSSFVERILQKNFTRQVSKNEILNILSVTRLSPRKGLKRLINAVDLLIDDGFAVNLKIIGEGSEHKNLQKEIKNQQSISLMRAVSDEELIKNYLTADLFALLPMQIKGGEAWEGFGIVFLEAGVCGLPIITSDSGGIKESTSPLATVYLHEKCSANEIYVEIKKFINNKKLALQLGELNKKWASDQTWENRKHIIDRILIEVKV
jgi:glycosyltransferase involved in cell wall biosynthesis